MEYFNSGKIKICIIIFIVLIAMGISSVFQMRDIQEKKAKEEEMRVEMIRTQYDLAMKKIEAQKQGQSQNQSQNQAEQQQKSYDKSSNPQNQAIEEGIRAKNEGDIQRAMEQFQNALSSDDIETKKTAINMLIDCYKQKNDKISQIALYKTLANLESFPTAKKDIYENLGLIYFETGDYNKALEAYNTSYEIEPNGYTALKICDVYEKLNDKENLKNLITRHISNNPQDRELFGKYGIAEVQAPEASEAPQSTEEAQVPVETISE